MSIEATPYFMCNGCRSIQVAADEFAPAEAEVRVVSPETGEQFIAIYLICRECRKKLEKGHRLHPEG